MPGMLAHAIECIHLCAEPRGGAQPAETLACAPTTSTQGWHSTAVDVAASPSELKQLVDQGYLVRPGLLGREGLARLRGGLDALETVERPIRSPSASFGGWFPRWLMEKDSRFLDLLYCQPLLSVARAVLGPQVRVKHSQGRVK